MRESAFEMREKCFALVEICRNYYISIVLPNILKHSLCQAAKIYGEGNG